MSDQSDHSDLIDMDIQQAMRIKFERGRERYEHGPWVGPEPIYAAHDEVLDFLVYINKAREGMEEELFYQLMKQGLDLIQGVRVAIAIHRTDSEVMVHDEEDTED